MTFDEILAQVMELLQREGRVSYRALKVRFNLDDEYVEGLKDELIEAKWVGWVSTHPKEGYSPMMLSAMLNTGSTGFFPLHLHNHSKG